MDFFKKGKDLLNKNKTGGSSSTTTTTAPTDKPAENKDYGDKGSFSSLFPSFYLFTTLPFASISLLKLLC